MLRLYACITEQHDLRLVVLAVLVCLLSAYTALSLFERARRALSWRGAWLLAAACVAGSGVWATHFVAVLAFRPGLPIAFDLRLTILSILVAIILSGLGLSIARRGGLAAAGGGLVFALGIGAMHYLGMKALIMPAQLQWDLPFVAASLAVGIVFAAAALLARVGSPRLLNRIAAPVLLTLAICGLHFIGMAALHILPDPLIPVPASHLAPDWLAFAIAIITLLIIALGLAGSWFDRMFAERVAAESGRLRAYVAELEATEKALEKTAAELAAARDAATESDRAKSRFLAAMSHELRTPLNAIIGFSEIMAQGLYGPLGDRRYREYAQDIRDSGAHLLSVINDVLDLSKLDAGRFELQEDEIELLPTARNALHMVAHQAEAASVHLIEAIEPSLPRLRGDERRLRQILLNLLSNAIKFTPPDGSVTLSVARQGESLVISVADTGIGIAPEDIPKALERFRQIDSRLARRYDGTGLGLPLSKRMAELMGARFTLESEPNIGTKVSLTFPSGYLVDPKMAA